MDENLIDLGDLNDVLSEFNDAVKEEEIQDEEMAASQRRYDEYIKKHKE